MRQVGVAPSVLLSRIVVLKCHFCGCRRYSLALKNPVDPPYLPQRRQLPLNTRKPYKVSPDAALSTEAIWGVMRKVFELFGPCLARFQHFDSFQAKLEFIYCSSSEH